MICLEKYGIGRLFTDLWLLSQGKEILDWGSDDINLENETRREYISALQVADRGDYEKLKRFMFSN